MSSVSSVSSSVLSSTYDISGMQRRQRPDSAKMAEDLFSKLDTTGKGYIEQSDLTSALSGLSSSRSSSSSSSTTSASELFSQLDSNSDGKVTKDELSATLKKLTDSLDAQFNQMRMQGAMPPPPDQAQGSDEGFTKDELTSQLSAIGSSDSKRSSLISNVVQNFDAADTNQDGKVSFSEAMAYSQSSSSATSTASDTTSSTTASTGTQKTDAQVFRQLMDLIRAYGTDNQSSQSATASLLSVSA